MVKVRFALLGVLTLLVLSGVMTSTAPALGPYWRADGSRLEAPKQIKLQSKGTLFLKAPGTFEMECKNSISEGATIEGAGEHQGQAKGRLSFSSCTVTVPTAEKCKAIEPIITNQIKAYLANAEVQTNTVEVFESGPKSELASIQFVKHGDGKCTFENSGVGVAGVVVAELIPAGVQVQEGMLVFPKVAILKVKHETVEVSLPSLKTVGTVSTFSGVYGARLATFPEEFGVFAT